MMSGEAATTACTCPKASTNVSRATQSGPAVCIAAQDDAGCEMQMFSVPQPGDPIQKTERQDKEALERLRRQSQPRAAPGAESAMQLNDAFRIAPASWTNREFDAVLRAIAGVAERRLGPDGVAGLDGVLHAHAEELRQIFVDVSYQQRSERLGLGSYDASVAYGCIQVTRSTFVAVIRAPFPGANPVCVGY